MHGRYRHFVSDSDRLALRALYTPHFIDISVPRDYPGTSSDAELLRQAEECSRANIPALKKQVFSVIEELLQEDRLEDITFSYLVSRCYCQPSSITYYFKGKTDMLLQFTMYYVERGMTAIAGLPSKKGEGTPTVESFFRFLDSVFVCAFQKSRVLYWVNYIVICNMDSVPKFSEYLCFSIRRKITRYRNTITFYQAHGFLNEAAIPRAFSELVFFSEAFALLNLFQVPIAEQELLLRTVRTRLITAFLKPEYLPEDLKQN